MKKFAALLGALLVSGLLQAAPAVAQPRIGFLSPSRFAGAGSTLVLSNQEDQNNTFHLVAWSREAPANALVEFEVQPTGLGNPVTLNASRVGADTWENFWAIPDTMADGNYTLRAILYSGGQQIALKEEAVQINRSDVPPPPAAETVEIDSPANGGQLGFFSPKGARPNTVFSVTTSDGTRQVRALYTTSAPGNDPEWKSCGNARVAERSATPRCTLAEGDVPLGVTAIAAVANKTPPPADPQPLADDSGDAHRVTPYTQVPSRISVDPDARSTDVGSCLQLSAEVTDQQGDPIANANVDVHATGPSDQLRFGTLFDQTGQFQQNSEFQGPDKGVHGTENAIDCSSKGALNKQGDHNRPGQNDDKHIESVDNTDNDGVFTFVLYSDTKGGTNLTVFADADDDDLLGAAEATGGAAIGWGEAPPPPEKRLFIDPTSTQSSVGSCQSVTLLAKEGGNPLSGANVDVHANRPDSNITFCPAEGQSSSGRVPDQGNHTAGTDEDGSIHMEGETDSNGRFVFGITSASEGAMGLHAWIDTTDEDLFSGEPDARGEIGWGGREGRNITLKANRKRVRRGGKVRLSGEIRGTRTCRREQLVKLQKRRGNRFKTVKSGVANSQGKYKFVVTVKRTSQYRSLAPTTGACNRATSRKVKVRAGRS